MPSQDLAPIILRAVLQERRTPGSAMSVVTGDMKATGSYPKHSATHHRKNKTRKKHGEDKTSIRTTLITISRNHRKIGDGQLMKRKLFQTLKLTHLKKNLPPKKITMINISKGKAMVINKNKTTRNMRTISNSLNLITKNIIAIITIKISIIIE